MVNFLVMGELRGGTWPLSMLLNSHPDAVCHSDLINATLDERIRSHRAYYSDLDRHQPFGGHVETYLWQNGTERQLISLTPSLPAYLERTVFTQTTAGETHAGVRLLYGTIRQYQLYEAIEDWCRAGTVCPILIDRNPVECFVSFKQAEASGTWASHRDRFSMPVHCDVAELVEFVRTSLATRDKLIRSISEATADFLHLRHHWLDEPSQILTWLADYLLLDRNGFGSIPTRRIYHRGLAERISNLEELKRKAPHDIGLLLRQAQEDELQWKKSRAERTRGRARTPQAA